MFQEPVVFLEQMARRDRSVLDCIYADYQIIDETLASHYGVLKNEADRAEFQQAAATIDADASWREVPATVGRGGLLTMAVFLTQNALADVRVP